MAIGCGRLALAVTAGLLSATLLRAQENLVDQLVFEPVVHNVFRAVQVTHAGDGSGRLFIVVQQGRIRVFDDERVLDEPFLDLTSQVSCCSERGLLSVAFHPQFESNGYFFVDYTGVDGDTVVSRFRVSEDPNVADPTSEEVLLSVPQPSSSHNGGQLQFGPDGLLYIGVGDGGANGGEAQSLYSLYGAILRVDVNQGNGYSIPATNPFAAVPNARGEIWVWGLRNPWRFSFDRRTGDMYIGDVGWDSREEIDLVPGTSPGGENFGWNVLEGNLCLADHYICGNPSLVPPILDHSHLDQACSGSVIGGYRYRGLLNPANYYDTF